MSKMQELLKNQEERSCQILAQLEKMETRLCQDHAVLNGHLYKLTEKLATVQEHLTSHRVASENGETPKIPPVPKRVAEYMAELMNEPADVRAKVHLHAGLVQRELTPVRSDYYKEHIEKYDVPEFMELLQEIPFRAIV